MGTSPVEPAVRRQRPTQAFLQQRLHQLTLRTALGLLVRGYPALSDRVVRAALAVMRAPRARADLLDAVVSWQLQHGQQPALAVQAYAARLLIADRQLARNRYRAAGESFEAAMSVAFHRVLHFDHVTSPMASDPVGFTAPLRASTTARAVRAPRGRTRTPTPSTSARSGETRVLLVTRLNADFLGEIREHFTNHPEFETRFVDVAGDRRLERLIRAPATIVEQTLAGMPRAGRVVEGALGTHLDWADVVFVEWGTALAALITQLDPGDVRVVVRIHSFEVFTRWPQLMDFTRIDDLVFVSDHLRDLAMAAVPGLGTEPSPRCHVIANAMDLRRFQRVKSDSARFTLALVGASKVVKDPRWAVEVLRVLRRHDERYRLLLVRGTIQDPTEATRRYVEGFRRDLAEFESSGAISVIGHTDDVPTVLQDVGVVVSSSARESFHMGLVEGAASGAVPVVRDWPYFPGKAQELFPADWVVDSPAAAAERILQVTASEEVWRRHSRAASAYVIERWDWELIKKNFERLLRR